jgi:hypothetical protein
MRGGLDALLAFLAIGDQQLGGNYQQRQAADQLQVRQLHQRRDDASEDDAQDHGGAGAEDHAPQALTRLQPATGQRDHQRIVAGEQNIDPDDLTDGDPEGRLMQIALKFGDNRSDGCRVENVQHPIQSPFLPAESPPLSV